MNGAQRAIRTGAIVLGALWLALTAELASAAGPAVTVFCDRGVSAGVRKRVEKALATRRVVKPLQPLPMPPARSPEDVADAARVKAIALAVTRARRHESEASWDACAREAAGALGDAIELLASRARFDLLRDLHLQIGICMSLGQHAANARPHFLAATLLDESPPIVGLHREEAERGRDTARAEVLARSRGKVKIITDPPGATVWIDGKKAAATTPLFATVRLGDHFITIRRFRFESRTERRVLQPGSRVRFRLEPARRSTLRQQLAAVSQGKNKVSGFELRLAQARWSKAEQLVVLSPAIPTRNKTKLALRDASSGARLRNRNLSDDADYESTHETVCSLLGEVCESPKRGIPWYVWPIAGVALVGVGVATGFIIDAHRETVFCPSGGCR